jgi:geranylgeranyl diphosphate synthase, type I
VTSTQTHKERFFLELKKTESMVRDYLLADRQLERFGPGHIGELATAYIRRPAKRMRPAVLLFTCGATGGDGRVAAALPAAAAIEMTHTWTLTHDDLIDRDEKRRGQPTVHVLAQNRARQEFDYDSEASYLYGQRIAILVGDAQHAWSVALLLETPCPPVDGCVVHKIVGILEGQVVPDLIGGESLDIQYERADIEGLPETDVVRMLWLKTGVLYRFSAVAGAMLGWNTSDADDPRVRALGNFASHCGTAFQLQDDILGIVGDEKTLGKPVGSDIREGKRTTILLHAFANSLPEEKQLLRRVVGDHSASASEIAEVQRLLDRKGSLEYTARLARSYVEKALPHLEGLPSSPYRELLEAWAAFVVERTR